MTALEKSVLEVKKSQNFEDILKKIIEERATHISFGNQEYELDLVSKIAGYMRVKEKLNESVGVVRIIFPWNYNEKTGKLRTTPIVDSQYRGN